MTGCVAGVMSVKGKATREDAEVVDRGRNLLDLPVPKRGTGAGE